MKKSIALALVTAMVLSLCACGGGGSASSETPAAEPAAEEAAEPAAETPAAEEEAAPAADDSSSFRIAAMFYKYDDVYLSTVRSAMEKYAEEAGNISFEAYDGQGDQGKQLDQLDIILEKGVDCIFVNMVDQSSAQTVIDKVKDKDISLVFYNREPLDITALESYDKCIFVGTQAEDAGVMQGDMLAEIWNQDNYDKNGDGVVQYVVMKGEADNVEAIARTEYCQSQAEADGLKIEAVAETQVCDWQADKAKTAMDAILASGKNVEAVMCNNDDMATGVISALQDAGFNLAEGVDKTVIVLGVDATEAGKSAISSGYMQGTVKQDGDAMAKACIDIAQNYYNGKEALDGTGDELDSTGVAIRIPYSPYYGE